MNNNQTAINSDSEYPEPFESGWMDIGSRTIDTGMHFTLEVDDSGFHLRKDYGMMPVNDLFGELDWWPTERGWEGQTESLLGLLGEVAPKVQLELSELLDLVRQQFVCYGYDEIDAYIADEQSQAFTTDDLKSRYSQLVDEIRIPGLPSDDIAGLAKGEEGEGTRYRGLELAFSSEGWSATIWEPDPCDEMFLPETWDCDTLDEVIRKCEGTSYFPGTRENLVGLLVDSDARWQQFIDADFSKFEESQPE